MANLATQRNCRTFQNCQRQEGALLFKAGRCLEAFHYSSDPSGRRIARHPGDLAAPGDAQKELCEMATKHHRQPYWDNVERVVRILVIVADEVAKLIRVFHIR